MISKLIAATLWVLAAAVAGHFLFASVYDNAVDIARIWEILDWFMAVGAVVVLALQYRRKRVLDSPQDDAPVSREYLAANFAFYASVLLAIWFFWNWLDFLAVGGSQSDANSLMWAFIDPLFVIVLGVTGCHIWNSAGD